jgi:hypothetical protein
MNNRLLASIFFTIVACTSYSSLIAQPNAIAIDDHSIMHLRKKKNVVRIYQGDYFGLTTASDTVKYFGEKIHSYRLFKLDTNCFVLRRPLLYKDTIVESKRLSVIDGREHLFGEPFRTGKKYYASIVLVDSYEYKTVLFKNISSIQYPPDAGNTMGCFSCAIIPVYNIFYFINLRKRWHPKNFPIGKWRMEISN